jgi:superfamily II DNA or RNA helicase
MPVSLPPGWISPTSTIATHVAEEARRTLAAYQVQPNLLREHVGIEEEVLSGGYGHRQIHELIQNAADAILENGSAGQVHLTLTHDALYCANEGAPIDEDGVNAILNSHMSRKRGAQIGQFGIGFKSVLAISSSPQFFCRSGSFGFDGQWAAERINEVLPASAATPVLRLARPLDTSDVEGDVHLDRLAEWATTIVRLPRNLPRTEWLCEDFARFPAEFLIFSPHVRLLVLEDRIAGKTRRIETSVQGSCVTISESGQQSVWTVFRRDVHVAELPAEARHDADRKTREREVLPLLWAVPYDARRARGQFWAFFPTETETSLTGILNAPWKTNADRQNLLDGPFNRALLQNAVDIVAGSLADLLREKDPGYLLDLLPARAADAAGWADKALIDALEPALKATDCVPSSSGKLRRPGELRMRPGAALAPAVAGVLEKVAGALPSDWVHASVEKRERRAKAERIGVKETTVNLWLEDLVGSATPANSLSAVLIAGALQKELPQLQQEQLRQAKIILTAGSTVVAAAHSGLYLPLKDAQTASADTAVHPLLAGDETARSVLRALRVAEDSGKAQLDAILSGYEVSWDRVWELLRGFEPGEALGILRKLAARNPAQARTRTGGFKLVGDVLLPGPIIPEGSDRDGDVCVDLSFHRADLPLLHALGVTATPESGHDGIRARWFADYLRSARDEFFNRLQRGARPTPTYLTFGKSPAIGPLGPLTSLSEEGRAAMTQTLLPFLGKEDTWVLRHETRPGAYPALPFTPPVQWMLQKHGRLFTSLGIRSGEMAVGPALNDWKQILAVADVDDAVADVLELPRSIAELTDAQWRAALEEIRDVTDEGVVGRFYAEAAQIRPAPETLWCWKGGTQTLHPTTGIHLASDDETAEAHRQSGVPTLRVPGRAALQVLVDRWGMQRAAGTVRYVSSSSETPLADAFPGLRRYLPEATWHTSVQPCDQIWFESVVAGSPSVPLNMARVGDRLCYLQSLPLEEVLTRTAAELGVVLTREQARDALGLIRREERQRLISAVIQARNLAEKLALLVPVDLVFEGLPPGVQALLTQRGETSHTSAAEAALAVHGVEVLRRHASALAAAGLEPPSRWSGSQRAQEFVDEIGFPPEFAGFQTTRRDPTLDVDGPVDLKPLHDFQQVIGNRIIEFLCRKPAERALLSLPTGAGKTRVVVQAFAEAMRDGSFSGSVVWVAQSDELCEQAVQSWAQVWRNLGAGHRLRISRLWGQTNNRVVEAAEPHVVVATFQSLVSRLRYPTYEWLKRAGCVIIDEAHGSIAPSYTEILDQFGITARGTERPLIGLTATPFRSAADPTETQWLVNRYGRQRFDHGVLAGDDPYPVLQDRGILARVEQQVLEGASLTLSPTELADLNQFKRLPPSAELRLGEIAPRNARIVESIKSLPEDWPVLLFATSVEQAHLMAALLSLEGISAKAISGETEAGPRRHYIEEFRRGKVRVLSNYNVLSTGFDAPALRALYIARPVFSPVLYQQMLGRGLRGPLNGGKERCLVVNVQDNIAQFGEQLAFRHFEYLWRSES